MEDDYISVFEYEKNVNPQLNNVPFFEKDINSCNYGINIIDFSSIFNVSHRSTTPNLLASFIKLKKNDFIELDNNESVIDFNATSHLFYTIKGNCSIHIDNNEEQLVLKGDILISPCFNSLKIKNKGEEELQVYYINDSPLVNYLGNKAQKKIFKLAIYKNEFILQKLNKLSNPNNNRKGILLSNKDTELLGVNTIMGFI
jgi:hypothetical protein